MGSVLGGSAPSIPKPTDIFKPNKKTGQTVIGNQLQGVTGYYNQALPAFLGMQGQYSPQFIDQAFGFGGQALTGLTGLQRTAGTEAAQSISDLRAQELGIMGGQAPLTRGLMDALSPEQAAAVQASAQEAERARAASMGVTPQEQRMYQQTAREAAQASGRLGGNSAMAAEIMGREDVLARKRAEAAQARQNSYGLAGGFYTQPGLGLLGSAPLAYTAGTATAGSALGLGQSLGPELDYNMPLNLARERASAMDERNLAQYQADMQARQSRMGMIGGLVGMAAAPFTGGLSFGLGGSMAGGAAGLSSLGGLGGLGVSAGMGLKNMFGGGIPRATIV
jgi:hypothetical protein